MWKLCLIAIALVGMILCYTNLLINVTPSIPYGIYLKSSDKISIDDYVSFCLASGFQELGLKRGYLEPGGACNGSTSLVKKVIALPYDKVTLSESQIIVSGKVLPYVTTSHDSLQRNLTAYPAGTYTDDCYWVVGDYDVKHSWDSRYYGCIQPQQIISKVKPILIWK